MGTQRQDVIEINGKRYNASTGRLMDMTTEAVTSSQTSNSVLPQRSNGTALDGFIKKSPKPVHLVRHASHSNKQIQKSQTLMRSAVKKPATSPKSTTPETIVTRSQQLGQSRQRQQLSSVIKKSPFISKFGDVTQRSSVVKKIQDLPVKKLVASQQGHSPKTHSSEVTSQSKVVKSNGSNGRGATDHIERALATANAHEQVSDHQKQKPKRYRRVAHKLGISARAMAISTSVLAGVLLGGFFAIQNVPNLSMRVAAARAGFDASMPGYNPSGFSFRGPINYSPGQVTISFKSNTDDRSYNVTERASNWNSDALLANFVEIDNGQYQTYLDRGRTLYIYDGSNATWIDNGVWYQIEGNSDMTTDQLVRIAASI